MNIFIDTNIFLSFFHLTSDDLEELKKLVVLLKQSKVRLWLPDQVVVEFQRNRESKIGDALKHLREQKLNLQFPALCKDYGEYEELRKYQKEYELKHSQLIKQVLQDVKGEQLKADVIIKQLFARSEKLTTNDKIFESARRRYDIGSPPGKGNSLGDAINWESLMNHVPANETLYFVTDDKDYYSPLDDQQPNSFLLAEWGRIKTSELTFYRRMSGFFKDHFPSIKLATELEKDLLIRDLSDSPNFGRTHSLIAKLRQYSDFTADQLNNIASAAIGNNQVHWIINDPDIKGFFLDLVTIHRSQIDSLQLAWLDHMLKKDDAEE